MSPQSDTKLAEIDAICNKCGFSDSIRVHWKHVYNFVGNVESCETVRDLMCLLKDYQDSAETLIQELENEQNAMRPIVHYTRAVVLKNHYISTMLMYNRILLSKTQRWIQETQ